MVSPNDPHLTPDTDEERRRAAESQVSDAPLSSEEVAAGAEQVAAHLDGPRDVPRPIGPERMRALRELIEGGQYPSPEDVAGGLFQMFGRSD